MQCGAFITVKTDFSELPAASVFDQFDDAVQAAADRGELLLLVLYAPAVSTAHENTRLATEPLKSKVFTGDLVVG